MKSSIAECHLANGIAGHLFRSRLLIGEGIAEGHSDERSDNRKNRDVLEPGGLNVERMWPLRNGNGRVFAAT